MRVLIADDNEFVRRGIVGLLAEENSIDICGEASDSTEVIQKATELSPDLILLDVSMPGTDGLQAAGLLKEKLPVVKILIISQHDAKQMLPRALEAGAVGCVDKARLAIDLLPTIRGLQNATPSPGAH